MKLNIPQPCSQKWESMRLQGETRHCTACEKSIPDFSKMSDAEIIQHIENSKGEVCGRFHSDQLNRVLVANYRQTFAFSKGIVALLGLFSVTTVYAQQGKQQDNSGKTIQTTKSSSVDSVAMTSPTKNEIRGTVTDSLTKEPIAFAVIIIAGTKIAAATDFDGNYKLTIPDSITSNEIMLEISYVGYNKIKKKVQISKGTSSCSITKNFEISAALESYTIGLIIEESPKKNNFLKRLFRRRH